MFNLTGELICNEEVWESDLIKRCTNAVKNALDEEESTRSKYDIEWTEKYESHNLQMISTVDTQ